MRVGVYTRISEDVAGEGLGVARQEQDCPNRDPSPAPRVWCRSILSTASM
jgi:hypothetical protein